MTARPLLSRDQILRLGSTWDDGGTWNDVRWLADQFWLSDDHTRRRCWHHLLLAVGNFKRQAGRLHLDPLAVAGTEQPQRGDVLHVPALASAELRKDDVDSWIAFGTNQKGAGVATTTTVLAALWPDDHAIYDRRVHAAIHGVRVAADGHASAPSWPNSPTFAAYAEARELFKDMAARASVEITDVERALYELDRQAGSDPLRTWDEYGRRLTEIATDAA